MADHDSFLQAILASPDDLTTRLIYADWLEENGGQPEAVRAELIRVQCEMAQAGEYSARHRQLEKRELALLRAHKKEWIKPFRGLVLFARLFRGFVEEVTVKARTFRDKGARLFTMTPLRRVKLSGVNQDNANPLPLAEALTNPCFTQVRELDLSLACVQTADLPLMAHAPTLRSLTWLNLEDSDVGEAGIRALVTGPSFRGLRSLYLRHSWSLNEGIGDRKVNALAAHTQLEHLEELKLTRMGITDAGVANLAQCPNLRHLRSLGLDLNPEISVQGMQALAQSPYIKQLGKLSMQRCEHIGDEALRALLAAPWAPGLRELCFPRIGVIYYNWITDAGVEALAGSPAVNKLRRLDLEGHPVTDRGAEALEASQYLTALGNLNLRFTKISGDLQKRLRKRFGPGVCTFSKE